MAGKVKLAVNWAAACGGCDVSLLDIEERLLDLAAAAEVVYWPVAMDFKREDLRQRAPGEVDVGVFNGAIRTAEHASDARLMRSRCKILVAYGSCAAFGGIPGLGNLVEQEAMLETVYETTPSTENPEGVRPRTATEVAGHRLELPALTPSVTPLGHVVDVDVVVPGCPPTPERVADVVAVLVEAARTGTLPATGTVLASDRALCDECPRADTRTGRRMDVVRRPHQVHADPETCFLEQGLVCLGLATRGGCGASCIRANMPCRGCFGPTPEMLDPGAEAMSAIASLAAAVQEDDVPAPKRLAAVRAIADPAGTFYRFTLPTAILNRRVKD